MVIDSLHLEGGFRHLSPELLSLAEPGFAGVTPSRCAQSASIVPAAYAWPTLLGRDGDDLFDLYRHALEKLGQEKGTLGLIFARRKKVSRPGQAAPRRSG